MTINEIIAGFELQVSDTTELSTSEELIVANRVYNKICNKMPWEFLKKSAKGTLSVDEEGYFISLLSEDNFLLQNESLFLLQNGVSLFLSGESLKLSSICVNMENYPEAVYLDNNARGYHIINFSDRRNYKGKDRFVYLDLQDYKIRFTGTPKGKNYDFDYISVPEPLTLGSTPIFPARFHDLLIYGMAVDDQIIQMSPKASSYAAENQAKYKVCMDDMVYWNAQLIQM